MLKFLLSQFVKRTGRNPNNLEMILLKQQASKKAIDERKIVSMFDRSTVDANKPILGGKNIIETDEQMIQRFKKQNKDAAERLRNKKNKDPDEPEGFYQGGQAQIEPDLSNIGHGSDALMARNRLLTPGSQATTSTGLNYLLGEDNDTTRVPYKNAGPVILPKPKPKPAADPMVELQRIYDLYKKAAPGVSQETQKYLQQDFIQKLNEANISQEQFMTNRMQNNFAEGGPARQGFKMGKRAFLKLMGGVGAGIAGLKTGLLGLTKGGGKKVTKEVVKEVATGSGTPPPYFFKLVEKIKMMGDDTLATKDKAIAKKYKDYTMEEDFAGNIEIIKKNNDIAEDVYMSYKVDEVPTKIGKKKSTKVEEYEEFTARPDGDGKMKNIEQGVPDEVVNEGSVFDDDYVKFSTKEIEKADGGRIGYGKGDIVTKGIPALLDLVKNKFGKKAITTADKIKTPQKTLDREMFSKFKDRNPDPKRQITDDEFQDLMEEVGDLDAYNFDGTIGSANKIRKEAKDYQDYMYRQYKMGKLDPEVGDKSPARKKFLQQKFDEMEGSGDRKLMTRDEIEELSTFDLGTEMDQMKPKSIIPKDEYANYKNDFDKEILGMSEEDILMKKYPGMGKELAEQIANDPDPQRKAHVISMVEQTMEMGKRGMSGDEIIQMFKKGTDRTKQASGGLARMLGE